MRTLAICAMILFAGSISLNAKPKVSISIIETPAKTVCIKNKNANDANTFFSSSTSYFFEVYKPGSKADLLEIVNKLKAVDGVETCSPGTMTGDYCAITLTLKAKKDKAWFVDTFTKAGLGHIKMNNKEVV